MHRDDPELRSDFKAKLLNDDMCVVSRIARARQTDLVRLLYVCEEVSG